jgi:hypothetical protein
MYPLFRTLFFHPFFHVSVYGGLVVGSIYFYGPLVIMHTLSLVYFQWQGYVGIIGMFLSLISPWKKNARLHLWGTLLMLVGLLPYLAFSIHGIPQVTFYHPVTRILGLVFVIQSLLILVRFCYTKR